MSPFQIPVQHALISFDHGYIVDVEAELAATRVFTQTGWLECLSIMVLLEIRHIETFSASAQV
jgi:hypothetical protein